VLKNVVGSDELGDIEKDVFDILERLPITKDSTVDKQGRPALGVDCKGASLFWSRPLGDPFGGTERAAGRHPVKMVEPQPSADSPDQTVYLILGVLQYSEALLRLYAHPDLLKLAASLNGEDFVPFNEGMFIKQPGLGASVAWHQDGVTHWDTPEWDSSIHGYTFHAQLYGCTAANAVWAVPGSHHLGKIDILNWVAEHGSERLPDAVPYICDPGDVVIHNRQLVHGSFANTSPDWRVSFTLGYHRRSSVLDVCSGGVHNATAVYDEARICERSRMIGYGIDARRQRFTNEAPYVYKPFLKSGEHLQWSTNAKEAIHDYNLLDLSI
ncbi:MAG: phytanoyl-CoA dioxygenase family protein, partial [Pseudomonadota bacterium]|nr:phytanoyl-CoA dioxygenase family protein [Pseudomonadota bacterium]